MSVVRRSLVVLLTLAVALTPGLAGQQRLAHRAGADRPGLLDRPALLDVRDVSLTVALTALSEQSGVVVAFSPTLLASDGRRVDCRCQEASVAKALDHVLAGTSFHYEVRDGQVIVTPGVQPLPRPTTFESTVGGEFALAGATGSVPSAVAPLASSDQPVQDGTISGTVVDQTTKQPLLGARVSVVGTTRAAQTDTKGAFQIAGLTGQEVTVEVVRVGYRKLSQAVRVGTANLALELAPQVIKLDEPVTEEGPVRRSSASPSPTR